MNVKRLLSLLALSTAIIGIGTVNAEANNNIMLEKLSNPSTKIKTLTKKDCI